MPLPYGQSQQILTDAKVDDLFPIRPPITQYRATYFRESACIIFEFIRKRWRKHVSS